MVVHSKYLLLCERKTCLMLASCIRSDLIWSLAVLDPRVGHTMDVLSPVLSLTWRVLSTSWCCPSRPCVAFLACVHLALFGMLYWHCSHSMALCNCRASVCPHSAAAGLLLRAQQVRKVLFRFLAVLDPSVGHTMHVLSPFTSLLCPLQAGVLFRLCAAILFSVCQPDASMQSFAGRYMITSLY